MTVLALSFFFHHWLWHPLGYCASAGNAHAQMLCKGYNFWSGIGSDIGELTLIATAISILAMVWHHLNCHEPKCKRIGRHKVEINGHTWLSCGPHHRQAFPNKPGRVQDHARQHGVSR